LCRPWNTFAEEGRAFPITHPCPQDLSQRRGARRRRHTSIRTVKQQGIRQPYGEVRMMSGLELLERARRVWLVTLVPLLCEYISPAIRVDLDLLVRLILLCGGER
jgi:hypothetical protein